MSNRKEIFWRIGLAYIVLLGFAIAILYKVFFIQQVRGAYYRALADSITTRYASVPAERGNIYAADGRLLATSLPFFELRMDFKSDGLTREVFTEHVDSLSICLASLFGDRSKPDYKKMLTTARKRGDRYFLIRKNVNYNQLQEAKRFPIFRLGQYKGGLIVVQQNKRQYPYGYLAQRTIGYMRDATVQPVGLEGKFNEQLTGIPGKRLMQKVSGGQFLPINDANEIDPQNGKDLITTLDINLQDVAEAALLKTLTTHAADHGCCVIMEVKTGAIKAIANLGLDENGNYTEGYNYAVGESHEPGSIFKLVSMLALLEDGYIRLNDTVDLEGGVHPYWSQTMRDAEAHNLSRVDVLSAFAHSSNVGISKLIHEHYQHQPEKYLQHLRDLGLDQKLNIEIPGEQQPFIRNSKDERFTRYSLPWMSVGYEVNVSPLQMLTVYNAVANGGMMMKPYLIQRVEEYGLVVDAFEPQVLNNQICSGETLKALQVLLEAVVDSGTARNLRNPNYRVAGKTGTAQIADEKHGYKNRVYQSSFVGYFPADQPLYSCIVVVNAPRNGIYYGARVAAPVFKEVADKVFATHLDVHPDMGTEPALASFPQMKSGYRPDLQAVMASLGITPKSADGAWVDVYTSEKVMAFIDKPTEEKRGIVPDVSGMGLRDALYLLENSGLQVSVAGAGKVLRQSVPAGSAVLPGQRIQIQLSMK